MRDVSKLSRLRQVNIGKPCPREWDEMEGDEKVRFCQGCGCNVHNIDEMSAHEANELLADKVCIHATFDAKKGVLTKDGWIPRLLLAGAIAVTMSSCGGPDQATIEQSYGTETKAKSKPIEGGSSESPVSKSEKNK